LALPLVLRWAMWFRAPRWFTAGTAAVLLATVAVRLPGSSLLQSRGSMAFGINRIGTAVAYLCATIGSPFSFGRLLPLAMATGAVGLLLAACVAVRVVTARRQRPSQALLLMTGAYAFGAVVMVALGRSHFDMPSALMGRYLVPTGIVWTCLLALLWSMAPRWPARMGRVWARPITAALVLVAGHGIERADVARFFQRDRFALVGWAIELSKRLLTARSHEVAVRVLTRDGAEYAELPQKVRLQLE
jgi:hypothetical protein